TATALNMGSDAYEGTVPLKVDGKTVQDVRATLQSGEKRDVSASYTFAASGLHHVEFGDLAERQILVAGGVGLALRNPLARLDFDEGHGTTTQNEITGKEMQIEGAKWVTGKNGSALELNASHMGVNAQNADLYRKAFTLSAWVRIDRLANNGDLALFGGRAPMGADQDNSGTVLNVGIRNKKLFLGFQGNRRDVSGGRDVPTGKWLNLTYTYDSAIRKGSVYIDGELDRSATQEPYTGPLEIIGDAPTLQHGSFSIDDVLILQSSLSPVLVKTLTHEGFGSLLHGEFISDWRPFRGAAMNADVTAEVAGNSRISLVIETEDSNGKIASSSPIQIGSGTQSYKVSQLKIGDKIRFRAHLDRSEDNDGPTLRAITLSGQAEEQRWSTPRQWSAGKAGMSVAINQEEQSR
ncbi:MAG TPA: LamG-like jellyroll fold domain-containing protein, partial [Edaphobacter sp.]|nr:LamG-like jellyroll fold domain-containing protein [Edaphobacter sp.]